MAAFLLPAAYAVLVWWFTTGAILYLDGLRPSTFRWSMAGATALLLTALIVLRMTSGDVTAAGAYWGFSCAVLVWGWLEMSFLMGFVTGPRKQGCAARCGGWRHFLHAAEAIIYNEFATLIGAMGIAFATLHQPNRVAYWTYLVLWVMRLSAKLNLFLGVPNLGEKFLPPHLLYLKSFFKRRPINFLFPLSVTGSTLLVGTLFAKFRGSPDPFHATAYAALTSLAALALLEHWFMVLPLPSERLWGWALSWTRGAKGGPPLESRAAR